MDMNRDFTELSTALNGKQYTWFITGVAGFIGSNLLEQLLQLDQYVVGLDNFSTGYQHNLDEVYSIVEHEKWKNFIFYEGDIRDAKFIDSVFEKHDINYVLHQAALGSVPRSIADPKTSNDVNISGFLAVLESAKKHNVSNFVYAASSSTYGDHKALPKKEEVIGNPLSPYAITKLVNELYASIYARVYDFNSSGLRYFNVFGPRQDPNGAYAAVIPKWTDSILLNEPVYINGDGETSRDFCFIDNVVHANILVALTKTEGHQVFNIALGQRTTLNQLFSYIKTEVACFGIEYEKDVNYREFRAGDVRHSQADVSKLEKLIGYVPKVQVKEGLQKSMGWYVNRLRKEA